MFLPVMCCRHCYVGIHFAKIVHLFQMSKEKDNFFFVAFINAEWLTPYEREPPACSSPAVESIGGILREGDVAVCSIDLSSCPADIYPFMSATVIFM